jgi:hypothetical protein
MLDKKNGVVPDAPAAPAAHGLALPPGSTGPNRQASLPDRTPSVHPQSPAIPSTPLNVTGPNVTPVQGTRAIPVSASPPLASSPAAPTVGHGPMPARQPSVPDGQTLVLLNQAQNNISKTLLRVQGGMDGLEAKLASFAVGRTHEGGRSSQ